MVQGMSAPPVVKPVVKSMQKKDTEPPVIVDEWPTIASLRAMPDLEPIEQEGSAVANGP